MSIPFRLLGPVQLRHRDRVVELRQPKVRALLAVLALHADTTVSYGRLGDAVWERDPPMSARANLRTYVGILRDAFGKTGLGRDRVTATGGGYRLRAEPTEVDAEVFTDLATRGRTALVGGDPERAAVLLDRALALWRAPAGEDLPNSTLLNGYLGALNERRLLAREDLIAARLASGEPRDQIAALRCLLAEHPLRESAWATLMATLDGAGDVAGALHAYTQARAALADRLGLEPGNQLQALLRHILARRAGTLRSPGAVDSFLGRCRA